MELEKTIIAKNSMITALEKSLGIVTTACKLANVNRQHYYQWLREDPDFSKKVNDITNIVLDFAESSLHKQIQDGIPSSTIFFLKTRGRGRGYIEKINYVEETDFEEKFKDKTPEEISEELRRMSEKMANAIE